MILDDDACRPRTPHATHRFDKASGFPTAKALEQHSLRWRAYAAMRLWPSLTPLPKPAL